MEAALHELRRLDNDLQCQSLLAPDIALCRSGDAVRLMSRAAGERPIFVRHLAPAQTTVPLRNSEQDVGALAVAIAELPTFAMLERGQRFAVQTRFAQGGDQSAGIRRAYGSGYLNQQLAAAFAEETGAIESIKKPQVVVSLLCADLKAYAGISLAGENLSDWPGGMRHYAQLPEQISRSEFKLLEALETFGISLPDGGDALDLGAAPGGWTRLLRDAGMRVVAVDPARLDGRLGGRLGGRVEHYRGYAEDFLEEALARHKKFDVITNDMRIDAREAARLLVQAGPCLRPDGFIISTLKLPHTAPGIDPSRNLKEALRLLDKRFAVVQVRQLFHNRQEVTMIAAQPRP